MKETDFVVQNTGDVVDRDAVAGELRDTTEGRGDGSCFGGRGIFGMPEVEKLEAAAAAEIEKVKNHN